MNIKVAKSKSTNNVIDLSKKTPKKSGSFFKSLPYFSLAILFFGLGILASSLYWKYYVLSNKEKLQEIQNSLEDAPEEEESDPILGDGSIRSPLNGVKLKEEEYEKISQHIPHAVMISNNKSARTEQYGLNSADIVYEAEVEGGITRFMAIFWTKQGDYIIKPVRSVRKYFFDWALEYGNIPVSLTGFAQTDNYDSNAWGLYKEQDIRVTYWDWPFKWDDECISKHPSMHCKRTSPENLYRIFDTHEWSYESWEGFQNKNEWKFDEKIDSGDYESVNEVSYDFGWDKDWSTKWVYNPDKNVYEKYDPYNPHLDMNDKKVISASTVIIQVVDRVYTGDSEGRVTYNTMGSNVTYILRNGKMILGVWERLCRNCRTNYFHVQLHNYDIDRNISLNPGLIWIAAVPSDKEIRWIGDN